MIHVTDSQRDWTLGLWLQTMNTQCKPEYRSDYDYWTNTSKRSNTEQKISRMRRQKTSSCLFLLVLLTTYGAIRSSNEAEDTEKQVQQEGNQEPLAAKKAALDEQPQEMEEELQHINNLLATMEEIQQMQQEQRDHICLMLQEVKTQWEENNKKLQAVEKEISESEREATTEKTEGCLRVQQILLKTQWEQEKRKGELENLQLNTEKQLQSLEGVDDRMRERKREVENHVDVINQLLKELNSENQILKM